MNERNWYGPRVCDDSPVRACTGSTFATAGSGAKAGPAAVGPPRPARQRFEREPVNHDSLVCAETSARNEILVMLVVCGLNLDRDTANTIFGYNCLIIDMCVFIYGQKRGARTS